MKRRLDSEDDELVADAIDDANAASINDLSKSI